MKIAQTVLILVCIWFSSRGQEQNYFLLEGKFHYGFVMAHSYRVDHLVTGHTHGFQLNAGLQGSGNKMQQVYNTPQSGLSIGYVDLANPEVLGSAVYVLGYVDLPVIRKNNFLFSMLLGEGLSFNTKKFDAIENHKNTVVASHVNAAIQIYFQTKYVLTKQTDLRLSVGMTHFSNGSYSTPNLGINNLSLSTGIVFYFDTLRPIPPKALLPAPDNRIRLELIAAAGPKEIYPAGGKKYCAWTFSADAFKMLSHKYRLSLGTDYTYDLSLTERFARDSIYSNAISDRMRLGISVTNELILGRFTAMLALGFYIYSPYKHDGDAYHRIGLKYFCSDHWFINNTLRTHYGKADNVELGLGYRF